MGTGGRHLFPVVRAESVAPTSHPVLGPPLELGISIEGRALREVYKGGQGQARPNYPLPDFLPRVLFGDDDSVPAQKLNQNITSKRARSGSFSDREQEDQDRVVRKQKLDKRTPPHAIDSKRAVMISDFKKCSISTSTLEPITMLVPKTPRTPIYRCPGGELVKDLDWEDMIAEFRDVAWRAQEVYNDGLYWDERREEKALDEVKEALAHYLEFKGKRGLGPDDRELDILGVVCGVYTEEEVKGKTYKEDFIMSD